MKNEFRIQSPTQACRVIEQILKTCTNSTITIKTNSGANTIASSGNKRSNSVSSSSMLSTAASSSSTEDDEEGDMMDDDSQASFSSSYVDRQNDDEKCNSKRIKYGPIQVKPRVKAAPTLATGRKSKDHEVWEFVSFKFCWRFLFM